MKITEMQQASLTISLSTLGQVDVSDNDPDVLVTLEYLLEQALENVRRALGAQWTSNPEYAPTPDHPF